MKHHSITKNTMYITSALTFQKVLSFIYFWFISNSLFAQDLGKYVFALSFTTLFSVFTDLGLAPILTREASKDTGRANQYLKNVFGIKLLLSAATVAAVVFFINISGKAADIRLLVYLASIIMVLDTFTIATWSTIRALQNLTYESATTVIVQIIIFVIGVAALKTTGQVTYLMFALIAASIFNFIFSSLVIKLKLKFSLLPTLNKKTISRLLKIVPAFALGGIFAKIYATSDSVILGYLASDQAVGFYAIPAKVITALTQILPAAFASALFPVFSQYAVTSREKLTSVFHNAIVYVIAISVPTAFGIIILMEKILSVIWPAYVDVALTFSVMAAALPFVFITFPTGYLLNAADRQKINALNRGIITAAAIILNFILIPKYSFLGAGITFLAVNVILFVLDLYWSQKIVQLEMKKILVSALKCVIASTIMAVTIYYIQGVMNLFVTIGLGGMVYFAILLIVKGIDINEVKKSLALNKK